MTQRSTATETVMSPKRIARLVVQLHRNPLAVMAGAIFFIGFFRVIADFIDIAFDDSAFCAINDACAREWMAIAMSGLGGFLTFVAAIIVVKPALDQVAIQAYPILEKIVNDYRNELKASSSFSLQEMIVDAGDPKGKRINVAHFLRCIDLISTNFSAYLEFLESCANNASKYDDVAKTRKHFSEEIREFNDWFFRIKPNLVQSLAQDIDIARGKTSIYDYALEAEYILLSMPYSFDIAEQIDHKIKDLQNSQTTYHIVVSGVIARAEARLHNMRVRIERA